MTTLTNKIFLLIGLLLWVSTTFASEGEADFHKLSKSYTLNADGSQELRVQKELTLNTHIAMNSLYGETFIVYNPLFQNIKFHTAYTKQADGNRIEVPANAYNEVLPRAAADAPAYNHLKEMVVTHTGLELGATIYLDYSVLTKPGYYPALDIDDVLQELSPIKEYTVTVTIPENTPLNYCIGQNLPKPSVKNKGGNKQYQWVVKNIPASSKEPFQPLNRTNVKRITASTYPTTETALAHCSKQLSLHGTLNKEWTNFTQTLLNGISADKDKVKAIHAYVLNQVATSGVSLEEAGYTLRCVNDVLRTGYGTAAEKTALLAAMLQSAGISADMLVIYPSDSACGLKSIREFAVKSNNEYFSVTAKTCSLNDRNQLDAVWSISATKAAQENTTARPRKTETTNTITAAQVQALPANNGYAVLPLGCKSDVKAWGMNLLNSTRTEVLELPYLIDQSSTYTVTLPVGTSLQTPATEVNIDKPVGTLNITIRQAGDTVTVTRKLILKKQQIKPTEYNDFRALITTWLDKNTEQLLLQTK